MRKKLLLVLALLSCFALSSLGKSNKEECQKIAAKIEQMVESGSWFIQLDQFNPDFDMYYDQLSPERNFVSMRDGVLYRYVDLHAARKVNNGTKYEREEEKRREQPNFQMRSRVYVGGKQIENNVASVKTSLSKNCRQMRISILFEGAIHPFVITVALPSGRVTTMPIFFGDQKANWQGYFRM